MSGKVVIVLGMHRSYTSLLASWLHQNGVVMYDRHEAIVTDTLCEDPDITELHVDIIKAHGMNWLNVRAPLTDPEGTFHAKASQLWNEKSALHNVWGWKDPRTCVLYHDLWSEIAREAKLIFIYRNPMAVVDSLYQRRFQTRKAKEKGILSNPYILRWWMNRHRGLHDHVHLNCWNYYNRCCLNIASARSKEDILVVRAEELVSRESQLRQFITEQWGIPLGTNSLSDLYKSPRSVLQPSRTDYRKDLVLESEEILAKWQSLLTF